MQDFFKTIAVQFTIAASDQILAAQAVSGLEGDPSPLRRVYLEQHVLDSSTLRGEECAKHLNLNRLLGM